MIDPRRSLCNRSIVLESGVETQGRRRNKPAAAFLAAGLCAAGLAMAQTPPPADAPLSPEAQRGFAVYTGNCAACHGPRGRGAQGPSITGPMFRYGSSDEELESSIRGGHPAGGMPSFNDVLSSAEIKEIIAFIRSQADTIAPGELGPLPTIVPADPWPTGVVRTAVQDFRVEKVAQIPQPFGLAPLPNGGFLVTQTTGALRIVDKAGRVSDPIIGIPKGLPTQDEMRRNTLDVALHPDYAKNGWIYLTWAEQQPGVKGAPGVRITLSRGRIKDGRWIDNQNLLTTPSHMSGSAKIAFDGAGHVFYPILDADVADSAPEKAPAQDLSLPGGKILRLNDDGSVPSDNPFVGRKDAFPYVWSYGHRAPLGLAFDHDGLLWETENGPRGGDELNLILPAKNYGWPVITWGHRYDDKAVTPRPQQAGMEQPVYNWSPTPALSSIRFYNGTAFPKWKGSAFIGTLKYRSLMRATLTKDRVVLLETILFNVGRMRDLQIGPDGLIYLITDGGELMRLRPAR
ncbi:PQQ-dependent sugar dehydrogenase [Rhizorhabdus argentea]|uniref:PQQ-dependent sugar dehydrogenase n=1 Tax=Rhizorhabdus argentea TaxID=1387174 RepID=UPI0030EEECE3